MFQLKVSLLLARGLDLVTFKRSLPTQATQWFYVPSNLPVTQNHQGEVWWCVTRATPLLCPEFNRVASVGLDFPLAQRKQKCWETSAQWHKLTGLHLISVQQGIPALPPVPGNLRVSECLNKSHVPVLPSMAEWCWGSLGAVGSVTTLTPDMSWHTSG